MKQNTLTYQTYITAMLLLLVLSACSSTEEMPQPMPEAEHQEMPILWNVRQIGMKESRALIEDSLALQAACTVGSGDKAIGIWSEYVLEGKEKKNVLGNPNGDVSLVFYENVPTDDEGNKKDNWKGWLYGDSAVHWTSKAKYTFNAYYPMSAVREISSSDVSTFVVEYNTEHYQEDLMMAYAYVDTEAADFNSKEPVSLNMLHTLSALKFRFMFMNADGSTYEDSDALTACWLENTVSGQGLATTGDLAFGTINDDDTMDGEHIHWYHEDHPEPSTATTPRKMYPWEDADGVSFSSTTSASTPGTSHTTDNQFYSSNGGWILTIPQETDGTTQLCFRLESTDDLVHRVTLPTTTYEPGKRYTYDIRFGQTEVTVKLKIAAWNELKSSYDIPL